MKVSNRVKNAVLVKFSEDFVVGTKTYFKKGDSQYMHKDQAAKFKQRGAKFNEQKINVDKIIAGREARNFKEEQK